MIGWLLDTFVATGLLIALVLVLRGPVSRHFGPQVAYALWALPFLRLLIPPLILPAHMAPEPVSTGAAEAVVAQAGSQAGDSWLSIVLFAALAVWLGGAALFLVSRCRSYRQMRRWLLAGARPVGEIGTIRMVESPALSAPVAFGVFDRVIALPMDFMAMEDRNARDLAIEHELAHHRGHDLLANILAQPLLALHWFNPLAWRAWRAMRRDQEAACDARVMARREPWERAKYGRLIASFAVGSQLSLAAPMACPMRGEKSVIHRLRSLANVEVPLRRRLVGWALLAGGVLALPLSASVSYAEPDAAEPTKTERRIKMVRPVEHVAAVEDRAQAQEDWAEAEAARAEAEADRAEAMALRAEAAAERAGDAASRVSIIRTRQSREWEDAAAEAVASADEWEAWGREMERWGEQMSRAWDGWTPGQGAILPPAPVAPAPPPPPIASPEAPAAPKVVIRRERIVTSSDAPTRN